MMNRKLLYIYAYRNGRRQSNVGFVECKRKGSKYKIKLSLKIPYGYVAENMNICLFKYEDGIANELKLGTLNPLNDLCYFSTTIDSEELEESGFSLSDMPFVYIFSGEKDRYVFSTEIPKNTESEYRRRCV